MWVGRHIVRFGHSALLCYEVCLVKLVSAFDNSEVLEGHSGPCACEQGASEGSFGGLAPSNSTAVIILP